MLKRFSVKSLSQPIVNKPNFFEVLRSLKETRKLSSESEAMVKPFLGSRLEINLVFRESESTFATTFGNEFKGGNTVWAEIEGEDVDCSILFPKTKSNQVNEFQTGETFQVEVKVLAFDNLYQRIIFGICSERKLKKSDPEENNSVSNEQNLLESKLEEIVDDFEESCDKKENLKNDPEVGNENKGEANLDDPEKNSENLNDENNNFGEKENSTLSLPKIANEETPSSEKGSLQDGPGKAQDGDAFETTEEKKVAAPTRLPPPLPEKKSKIENDPNYLDQLRDKRYEYGPDSLTDEEKEALANDLKINAASRQKDLEVNKKKVNKVAQVFFGFIMVVFSLNSCSKGGGFPPFITFCFGLYLLFPLLKKLKELNDMD